jgi:hypothetical protein
MNYLTLRADSDGTIDETTWGFGGYGGEAVGRLMNKKVTKGDNVLQYPLTLPTRIHSSAQTAETL